MQDRAHLEEKFNQLKCTGINVTVKEVVASQQC